jgi:Asp-tRNA(Asn)/Glu-tRNA(Gln) amidotransferase A subunit family amidase
MSNVHPVTVCCAVVGLISTRAGQVTPTQTVEACLARIAEREPSVRAFLHVAAESARAEAAIQTEALARGDAVGSVLYSLCKCCRFRHSDI